MADYKRIMELGSWLNRYLSSSLSRWDIDALVDDSLKILNVDYVRSEDDPAINTIKDCLGEFGLSKMIGGNKHIGEAISGCTKNFVGSKNHKLLIHDLVYSFFPIPYIEAFLQKLQMGKDIPWVQALSLFEGVYVPKSGKQNFFLSEYNNIREVLIIRDNKVEVVNKMVFSESDDALTWVRFPALICRIFINFIREGGRDYCTLCKYCGKFILAERKGRRQFCGGACRIAHKRKEDRKVVPSTFELPPHPSISHEGSD